MYSIISYVKNFDYYFEDDENIRMLLKVLYFMIIKFYLLYNMVRVEDFNKVNGVCSIIIGRIFGCSKVFLKRFKYLRDKFLNLLGKNGSLFRVVDKKRKFVSCFILKGNRINLLLLSFKFVSFRSW